MKKQKHSLRVIASEQEQKQLRSIVEHIGEVAAAQSCGISTHALARLLAGFQVNAATLFMVKERLKRI